MLRNAAHDPAQTVMAQPCPQKSSRLAANRTSAESSTSAYRFPVVGRFWAGRLWIIMLQVKNNGWLAKLQYSTVLRKIFLDMSQVKLPGFLGLSPSWKYFESAVVVEVETSSIFRLAKMEKCWFLYCHFPTVPNFQLLWHDVKTDYNCKILWKLDSED